MHIPQEISLEFNRAIFESGINLRKENQWEFQSCSMYGGLIAFNSKHRIFNVVVFVVVVAVVIINLIVNSPDSKE